jgi:DNA-binding NarL/FixJ family response regulator
VVVVSLTPSVSDSVRFFEAGASGYCHALATSVMLHQVVESVLAGGVWIGVELMQQMVHRLVQIETKPLASQTHFERLTAKEKQVAELVVQGFSNKEVANALIITERTVKAHLASTFEKLQVRDRIQLTLLIRS